MNKDDPIDPRNSSDPRIRALIRSEFDSGLKDPAAIASKTGLYLPHVESEVAIYRRELFGPNP